jgi:hypothetical protein
LGNFGQKFGAPIDEGDDIVEVFTDGGVSFAASIRDSVGARTSWLNPMASSLSTMDW